MNNTLRKLRQLKFNEFDEALENSISIELSQNSLVLVPVGRWILNNPNLVNEMVEWREAAKDNFFARFLPSAGSFFEYLKSHSINKENAILFMIFSAESGFRGHIGLDEVSTKTAEIDAVMLSPSAQGRGVAKASLATLISWSRGFLELETLTLEVISNNEAAIALYSGLGFKVSTLSPLKIVHEGSLTKLVDAKPGEEAIDLSRVRMANKIKDL
jgi:RimJ/RimL family protein N-acetyltransferase